MSTANFLHEVLQEASSESDPEKALEILMTNVLYHLRATSIRLFKLDSITMKYMCIFQKGRTDNPPIVLFSPINNTTQIHDDLLQEVASRMSSIIVPSIIEENNSKYHSDTAHSRIIVPILSGVECSGIIDVESESKDYFTEEHKRHLLCVASYILLLFEKHRTIGLFQALQKPIDFQQRFEDFLGEILILINEASKMPFIVLRKYIEEEDKLECVAHLGFSKDTTKSELDLFPVSEYPTFDFVIKNGKSKYEPDMKPSHLVNLKNMQPIKDIKSFVVTPVNVGTDIYGTLSFACSFNHFYSNLEIEGFVTIANGIGVAISNYSNFYSKEDARFEMIKTNTIITSVEVAQAVRHQALNYIEDCKLSLALIRKLAQKPTSSNIKDIPNQIEDVFNKINQISFSLDHLKTVTKPPAMDRVEASISEVLKKAFSVVTGRLLQESIEYRIEGKSIIASVYEDFLIHAFLNLILNSIDAFKLYGKKSGRKIIVYLEEPSESSENIEIRYNDNASGINIAKLQAQNKERIESVNDIFLQGVTSKKSGSGYGLFLVRRIMEIHGGSIYLSSHKNGVQFKMYLPKVAKEN